MRLKKIHLFFLVILIASCEGIIRGKGKIISASSKLPIDSVCISWFSKTIYSDRDGNFSFHEFVGCVPSCPDIELVLTKQGYKPLYINLTEENKKNKTVFELMPANEKLSGLSRNTQKQFLFYLSIATAFVSLSTLIRLATMQLKHKLVWAVIILFGTFTIHYNYIAETIALKIFRPSFFVFVKPAFEPGWYLLNLPIGLIVFWVCHYTHIKYKAIK